MHRFALYESDSPEAEDARFDERLLGEASIHGPIACIWQTRRSLVVPRTYARFDGFDAASARFAARGWPVTVRQTGGGIVPQGPGIFNISLAYAVDGPPLRHSDAGYRLICRILADALAELDIPAFPAAVDGSFCDGRYNLAVQRGDSIVKIAGTAQMWRRIPRSGERHIGLVHALVLVDTGDIGTAGLTQVANDFEEAIGSGRRYRADRVVSAAELLGASPLLTDRFDCALRSALLTTPASIA